MGKNKKKNRLKIPPPKELEVLKIIQEEGKIYAVEIVNKSKGEIKKGSIYNLLDRLAKKGLIGPRVKASKGDLYNRFFIKPRFYYTITALGKRVLKEYWKVQQLQ